MDEPGKTASSSTFCARTAQRRLLSRSTCSARRTMNRILPWQARGLIIGLDPGICRIVDPYRWQSLRVTTSRRLLS